MRNKPENVFLYCCFGALVLLGLASLYGMFYLKDTLAIKEILLLYAVAMLIGAVVGLGVFCFQKTTSHGR